MRCSGLPTTCIGLKPNPHAPIVHGFEALLFGEILKPLAAGLGPLGEVALDAVARRAFAVEAAGEDSGMKPAR
jgi:hypothetical protein